MSKLVILCLISSLLIEFVRGSGRVSLNLFTFKNPDGTDNAGHRCDGIWILYHSKCDYQFEISLTADNQEHIYQSKVFQDQDDVNFDWQLGDYISNPIRLPITNFENGLSVTVNVMDIDDITGNDFVVKLNTILDLDSHEDQYPQSRTISSNSKTLTFTYTVSCDEHWYGSKCKVFCKPNDKYICNQSGQKVCKPGWLDPSKDCETTDFCFNKPCLHRGACTNTPTNFKCTCSDHFTGPRCETILSKCEYSKPCKNNGVCETVGTPPSDTYLCHCPKNFTGVNCVEPKCTLTCFNGGTCVLDQKNYRCNCTEDYKGVLCAEPKCPLTCSNGGTCVLDQKNYRCNCTEGYEGKLCADVESNSTYLETARIFFSPKNQTCLFIIFALIVIILTLMIVLHKVNGKLRDIIMCRNSRHYEYSPLEHDGTYQANGESNNAYLDDENNTKVSTYMVSKENKYLGEIDDSYASSDTDLILYQSMVSQDSAPPSTVHDGHSNDTTISIDLDAEEEVGYCIDTDQLINGKQGYLPLR